MQIIIIITGSSKISDGHRHHSLCWGYYQEFRVTTDKMKSGIVTLGPAVIGPTFLRNWLDATGSWWRPLCQGQWLQWQMP